MFQLVMQEGWTQLTSEVMCLRTEWWAMNFYFIVLHLFASLVSLTMSLCELHYVISESHYIITPNRYIYIVK